MDRRRRTRAVRTRVARQCAHGVKRVIGRSLQRLIGRTRIRLFERLTRPHAAAYPEFAHARHRQRRRGALQGSRHLAPDGDRGERRLVLVGHLQIAVQPAVLRALDPWRGRLHVILRVEVRARAVGRPARLHDRKRAIVPERLQRRHAGMKTEEPVEIDGRPLGTAGPRHRNRGTDTVVLGFAVGHDHVQSVDRAALKDGDQQLAPRAGRFDRPRQKRRREAERHHRHAARFEEDASGHHLSLISLISLWGPNLTAFGIPPSPAGGPHPCRPLPGAPSQAAPRAPRRATARPRS